MNVKYLENYNKEFGLLKYEHDGDAGFDLRAMIDAPITLRGFKALSEMYRTMYFSVNPNPNIAIIPTGVAFDIPDHFQIEIRPRSGLAAKYGISVVNSPGTIDTGYKNEIKVILINHGVEDYTVNPGERIAQSVIMPICRPIDGFIEVNDLSDSSRGMNGFGSTGVK